MNTIAKIWAAIKNAAVVTYNTLFGDAIAFVKESIATKKLILTRATPVFQMASVIGTALGFVLGAVFCFIAFPVAVCVAAFWNVTFALMIAKHLVVGYSIATLVGQIFDHFVLPSLTNKFSRAAA